MSSSQHKQQTPKRPTDFLCKVRYRNTLPHVPFSPKLLSLPSSLDRFNRYQSTTLVEKTPHAIQMPLDMGIPLDQAMLGYLESTENESYITPGPTFNPTLDAPLMQPVEESSISNLHSIPSTPAGLMRTGKAITPKTWLHRTKYIASEQTRVGTSTYREHIGTGPKPVPLREYLDTQAQIAGIERTFDLARDKTSNLATLRHPLKHNLVAVESYPILPNFTTWPTNYSLIQFDENPAPDGKNALNASSSRQNLDGPGPSASIEPDPSETGCLMPIQNRDQDETVLVWYLPAGDDDARKILRRKREGDDTHLENLDDQPPVLMRRIRDYNFKNVPAESPIRQFIITLEPDHKKEAGLQGATVARYATVRTRLQLKKRRPQVRHGGRKQVDEWAQDRPDILEVRFRGLSEEEAQLRREKLNKMSG